MMNTAQEKVRSSVSVSNDGPIVTNSHAKMKSTRVYVHCQLIPDFIQNNII